VESGFAARTRVEEEITEHASCSVTGFAKAPNQEKTPVHDRIAR
jgi:hypothetical protein